ncbi:MAG: hypothetical protein MO852_01285, partial [Candidatus Devosia euplotis]|nr:hypothetical protein [Candidatus Devosia euplotis]
RLALLAVLHCVWAIVEPGRLPTPSVGTITEKAKGWPSGIIRWLPFLLKLAAVSSSFAAGIFYCHQP